MESLLRLENQTSERCADQKQQNECSLFIFLDQKEHKKRSTSW